jgi:hypothetical protein
VGETVSETASTGRVTGAEMRALTDELPGPDGAWPLLILDRRPELAVRSEGAGPADPYFSGLLGLGLAPVTGAAIGEPPASAPGWRLELSGLRDVRLTAADGSVIWTGECGQAEPWRALINRTGRCAVLIGAIGLWAVGGEGAATRIETWLEQAARAGELVGGLVAAHC